MLFTKSGKNVWGVMLDETPPNFTITSAGELICGKTQAQLKADALAAARAVLTENVYEFDTAVEVTTVMGKVFMDTALSTSTKVFSVAGSELTPDVVAPVVYAKAPRHAVHKTVPVLSMKGTAIATPYCSLLEAALNYVTAEVYSRGIRGNARLAALDAKLSQAVEAYTAMPFAATFGTIHDGSGLFVSIPMGVGAPGATRAISQSTVDRLAGVFAAQIETAVGSPLGSQSAAITANLKDAIVTGCGRLLNVNGLGADVLTDAELAAINENVAAMIAQPIVLLDILGSNVDDVDSAAFADLVNGLALKIEASGLDTTFAVRDAPRSLAEILWYTVGLRNSKVLASVEAFYHRGMRPTIEPAANARTMQLLHYVHPMMLDASYVVTSDVTGRVLNIAKDGVAVTATYPDYLGLDAHYATDIPADAKGVISSYHGLMNHVFQLLVKGTDGLSPGTMAQLGITGVSTSNILSVR